MNPTVLALPQFDASSDATAYKKAMGWLNTNEKSIINLVTTRCQRQRTDASVKFLSAYKKELLPTLQKKVKGKFRDVVVALMTPLAQFYAKELHDAIGGIGTNEAVLIEILCTVNNDTMSGINSGYMTLYNTTLETDIKKDTSGSFENVLVALCQGNRDESAHVDNNAAMIDAKTLYEAGEGRMGTNETKFINIMTSRSLPHLRQMFLEYEKLSDITFEAAIKKEFNGDTEKCMLALVEVATNRPLYMAEQINASMAGIGTKDRALIRQLVTRAEIDLGDIKQAYETKYNKPLAKAVESETNGKFEQIMLALLK